jgi:hypothetical protein
VAGRRNNVKADPILVNDQLQAMQHILHAFGMKYFLQTMIWILTKQATETYGQFKSRLVPFIFNPIQEHLYSRLSQHNRVLKARQAGLTTFMLLVRLLVPIITEGGKSGMLISQNSRYASMHFAMVRRAYRHIGALDPSDPSANALSESLKNNLLHTSYSSRKELVFDMLDSKLIIESAEVEEAGQGVTLHHVVASEVARWAGDPEATISNIKGALVKDGSFDEETTANGLAGYFCEQYLASMNEPLKADAFPHYYSWFWSPEYEDELTEIEKDELMADLTSDELRLIAQIHKELSDVAYLQKAA